MSSSKYHEEDLVIELLTLLALESISHLPDALRELFNYEKLKL